MKKTLQLLLAFALLMPASLFSQDQCAPVGWATQNGGTTGGGNATPITVTTLSQLQTQASSSGAKVIYVSGTMGSGVSTRVNVAANKTIIGMPGAKLFGGFDVKASNVIIRNMIVQGPGAVDVNGVDCITIDGSSTSNVWIDHCDIYDGQDGNLDITNGANYIAITWCKFYYTSASSNHQFCNLIGNSDSKTSDRGRLRVTMMYNWWGAGCKERMPRVRYGQVHVVNNYFSNTSNSHCVRAGREANIRVESNYFDGVKTPIDLYQNDFTAVTAVNNTFVSTSGNTSGSGTAFTPPYSLSISPSANVKTLVMAGAGATLASPTSCGGAPPVTYTLTTSANPTAGGTVSGAGTYNSGTAVTVTATPASGYSFTGWSGDASGTATTITVNMNSNKNVVANFQATSPTTYTLTTTANPSAGGTVSGAGTYNSGSAVTVTATPASGYSFTGWSGDASGTNTSVTITMNSNKAVTANFQQNGGGGTSTIRIEDDATTATGLCLYEGAISNNGGANNGKVINLSNSAGRAVEWRVGAAATGSYTLNWRYVNSSTSNTYSMRLIVNGTTLNEALPFPKTSSSTVFANTTTAVTLNAGNNSIRLESTTSNATADIDWIEITGNAPTAANCSGEAPVNYTLSTTSVPAAGGTVTGAGTYSSGTSATVTATPAAGYTFTGWSGDASGTNSSTSVTMNSNKSVTANFAPITYTLTTSSSPAAGGTVTGAGTYNSGTSVTVTATPAAGYTFTGWSGDASGTNTSNSVTMNSNKSVTANFAPIT
ncbi:MAG TPA: InlB B-repeat-containing protein, partial [Ferruginibacter sp.]|nr:InlB B-repeat-containing protein [Ferruginibacter sp.]